jgi:GDP-4-dehydro-6-deoxy-D-mannose reductase
VSAAHHLPLVTGATGFAGSHLVDTLAAAGDEVAAWGNAQGRPLPRDGREHVRWSAVDLLDPRSIEHALAELRPRVIFHLAGLPHVAEAWKDSARPLQVNALGTHHLLDAVEKIVPSCKVVIAGSALVYRPSMSPLREEDPIGPADPYGVSKLAQ